MSLSPVCDEQYKREQNRWRRLLLISFLGSVGVHGILLALGMLGLWPRPPQAELSPIELVVVDTQPSEPIEDLPAATVGDEANNPAAAAPPPPPTEAPPRPDPTLVESPPPDSVEPPPETQVDSTPEPSPAETDVEDVTAEDPEESPVDEAGDALDPNQRERLRQYLSGRARDQAVPEAVGQADSETETATETGATDASADTRNASESTARATGETGSNPDGEGSGRGRGSRTVACQNCVLPNYPRSALNAGVEGTPRVQVQINPDGTVRSVTLVRSSGNAAIDQAAIQAARRSRFHPIAGGASVPIEYDLTIEGSQRHQEAQQRGNRTSVDIPDDEASPTAETADTPPETAPSSETDADTSAPAESPAPPTDSTSPSTDPADAVEEAPEVAPTAPEDAPEAEAAAEETPAPAPEPAPEPEPAETHENSHEGAEETAE